MSGGAPTSSGVEFAKAYAERLKSVQISILASALFAFIVEVAYLGATSGKDPVWAKSLPCTFQTAEVKDELTRVGKAIAALQSALDMVPLLLMIGAIGINAGLCQLAMPTKFPFRAVVVAWLWTTGSMLGLYTFVNVKELTNYQPVSEKACRVALSQLFYPVIPSSSGQDVLDEHKGRTQYVRERANLYFSNKAHYLAKFTRPDLTSPRTSSYPSTSGTTVRSLPIRAVRLVSGRPRTPCTNHCTSTRRQLRPSMSFAGELQDRLGG